MNNFTDEPFGLSTNLLLKTHQITPSPVNTPLVQAGNLAPLPLHDGGMPPRMFQLQHAMPMETNQQQAPMALPFEAMGGGNQLFPFNSNFGVQQGSIASGSGGSFLPFGGLVGGIPQWHQVNGVPGDVIAANNLQGLQAAIQYDTVVQSMQHQQYAAANGIHLLSYDPLFVAFHNTMLQQPALNATRVQPTYPPIIPSSSFFPQLLDAMAPRLDYNATQQLAIAYLRSTGKFAEVPQLQDAAMEDESAVPDLNNALDSLPEQMQGLTTDSPLAEVVASPEHDATENHSVHDPAFPASPLNPELSGNVEEIHNVATHNDATNASPGPVQRIMAESPVMDESMNPPAHNVPADGFVATLAEPEEQLQDLEPDTTQLPAPFEPQRVLSMAESSSEPSPVDPQVGEQAGQPCAPGNAPPVSEMPAAQPDALKEPIEFIYCVHPSERGSTASSSRDSTPPSRNWTRRSSNRVSNPAPARSSTKAKKRKGGPYSQRARVAHQQRNRRNSTSPSVETRVQEPSESLPLFAALPASDTIPDHLTAPGQIGPSAHYSLRDEMSLYDVFVAMRAENDRNRAAGVRNANGDEIFTWDESDIRLFDSLYRSSRR